MINYLINSNPEKEAEMNQKGTPIKKIRSEYRTQKKALKSEYKSGKRDLKRVRDDSLKTEIAKSPYREPYLPLLEEIGNAITHGVGALFSIVAFVFMLINSDSTSETVAACVYFFGLIVLFTMSCLYHAFPYGSKVKRVFRRFDHCSIYLLIGATFAPLLLCYIAGTYGLVFFIVQWSIIAAGITFVAVFGPNRIKWLHFTMYMLLGWSALLFMPKLLADSPAFFGWIISGGIIYTIGTIPFKIKRTPSHFIWHFFVLAGAVIQWIGIYIYIYLR